VTGLREPRGIGTCDAPKIIGGLETARVFWLSGKNIVPPKRGTGLFLCSAQADSGPWSGPGVRRANAGSDDVVVWPNKEMSGPSVAFGGCCRV